MKIKFSRHAKRRARLYGISETMIMDLTKVVTNYPMKKGKKK
jgi:hypothetical protein